MKLSDEEVETLMLATRSRADLCIALVEQAHTFGSAHEGGRWLIESDRAEALVNRLSRLLRKRYRKAAKRQRIESIHQ